MSLEVDNDNDTELNLGHPFVHQVRWKRKDGNSKFYKVKPLPRKKQKARNRRKAELEWKQVGRHSAPGSKAGPRREWAENRKEQLLEKARLGESGEDLDELDYEYADALLDDIMGNTSDLTRTPTPKPIHLGNKHTEYFQRVSKQMERYQDAMMKLKQATNSSEVLDPATLPSDHDISLVLRSFRDKFGTRTKPVGIAKALQHVLQDLFLPTTAFGEESFNALLTCCRTPKEARRIFRLMNDRQHSISQYSWSILVDIHAKMGDFEGCDEIIQEMVREGVTPTLAAYTSLLAACYKVCNAGHIPPSVRARAGKLGWEKWKEMRIVGIDPDVMAYGALLRICAARGKPERALGILEEMEHMEIKPTTLCFTSALRAVARSHQTAVRYENGWSKRNRLRENVTSHHGEMARQIVIMAESAEVEMDDGFISALMLCAGAAGDSATAKAILLAHEVQKLDHLRTIGSDEHLKRLAGEVVDNDEARIMLGTGRVNGSGLGLDGENGLALQEKEEEEEALTPEEREYGKDTRILSALMTACSQAVDRNLGTMWAGRENKGYLCDNSLRRIKQRPQPRYLDSSIPGMSTSEVNAGAMVWDEEQEKMMGKRERRRLKDAGVSFDESVGGTLDDISDDLYKMFKDEDPAVIRWKELAEQREQYLQLMSKSQGAGDEYKEDNDGDYYGDGNEDDDVEELFGLDDKAEEQATAFIEGINTMYYDADAGTVQEVGQEIPSETVTIEEPAEEWYFDQNEMKWKSRPVDRTFVKAEIVRETGGDKNDVAHAENDVDQEEEYYFDNEDMRWKTRPKKVQPALTDFEASHLQQQQSGSIATLEQSRVQRDEISMDTEKEINAFEVGSRQTSEGMPDLQNEKEVLQFLRKNGFESSEFDGDDVDDGDIEIDELFGDFPLDDESMNLLKPDELEKLIDSMRLNDGDENDLQLPSGDETEEASLMASTSEVSTVNQSEELDNELAELQAVLPGLPTKRLKKIRRAFRKSLNTPSLLNLVPLLRENMPEEITPAWLKRKNLQDANFCIEKAVEEDAVDLHMLNGMLQVATSAGGIDRALYLRDFQFRNHGLVPTEYSDRLVLQMLIKNNRISRALQVKQRLEDEEGVVVDTLTYGSFIDYYSRHKQVGSALMMLRECVMKHNSPPNEKSLTRLRLLCRQLQIVDEVGLVELAGEDPLEWLRHGERDLKREMSRKGRRDVLRAKNRAIQI